MDGITRGTSAATETVHLVDARLRSPPRGKRLQGPADRAVIPLTAREVMQDTRNQICIHRDEAILCRHDPPDPPR
ncbi:hypothetical protein [Xanthomonas arboricola]|uniref:hypothetical protein n=1 Tax=Xanthomonas arboricola TaxID=56448 RepID=UPI000F8C6101|nr:hypothetical protein [Xanthomonas arboricola]